MSTQLGKISLSDMAKTKTALNFGKAGGKGPQKTGPFVSPFAVGQKYAIEFTSEEVTAGKFGPQLSVGVSIMKVDGSLQKAGKFWLPLLDETAPAADQTKSGEKLRKVLRAIDPENFSVYATINKNAEPWEFIALTGEVLSYDEREARNEQINAAVMAASQGLIDGTLSIVGCRCFVTLAANPNNASKPYQNYSAE
jgi:hypothetical protein